MAKKDKNSLLNIHYSRTLTPDNLSKAANYVGEYVLKGLGAFGKFLNAGFTSPTYGTVGQVSYARNAEDAKRLRKQSEASEQAMGKAMTWVSPLNYGAAILNGHGLDARKGEEEVASWSPAWQAVGRLGELYVGPKAVKGVKSAPRAVVNTAAKVGVKPAKAAVVAREIKLATKNTKLNNNSTVVPHEDLFDFWHGGLESDFNFGNLDVFRKASKQSKRNRNYAGFYMYSTPRLLGAFNYGFGEAHGIKLKPDAKKLKVNFNTERIEALELLNYRNQGYDYIEGKDVWGAPEYILLNKDAIQHTGFFDHSLGHNMHILRDRNIPKVDLSMNNLPSKTSLKFFERNPSKISEAERAGVPKGDRNLPFKSKLPTEHVQGDKAVKMFKEYGGEPIPEGSINGELLRKYVAEARERYGLTNNKNITDEEIAQALYKHSKELGGNTAAVNAQGEPQLLFRGDTRRYTQLKERMSPEELATKSGTMDNSLGNLFLGELPGTAGKHTRGLERYLVTGNEFLEKRLEGSGTGSRAVMPDGTFATEWGSTISEFPEGSYHLVTYNTKHGPNTYYKLPSSYSESGVNDINAFVVRTPQVRDASREISVLNDDFMVKGGPKVEYHGPIRKEILDKDGFPLIVDEKGNVVADGLAGSSDRQAMALHYKYVLNDAKNKKQGLLKSNGETDGTPGNYLRDEHDDYTYFALPNFNIQGAKHLLPYDLRIPRNWKDKNIYRGLIPLTTGYTLYNIFNQPLQQLQYLKQGGKMNIINQFKNGGYIRKMQTAAGGPIKKPIKRLKDGYRYIPNEQNGGWDRISDNSMADVFATMEFTPKKTKVGSSITRKQSAPSKTYYSAYNPDDIIKGFNALTLGGLNNLSPTLWARRVYDTGKLLNGDMTWSGYTNSWINGNNGLVSLKFSEEHPYLSTGINLVGDIGIGGGALLSKTNLGQEAIARAKGVLDATKYGLYDRVQGYNLYNKFLKGKTTDLRSLLEDINLFSGENYIGNNLISDKSGRLFMLPTTYTRSELIGSGPSIRMGFSANNGKLSRNLVNQGKEAIDKLPAGTSISADAHGLSVPSRLATEGNREGIITTLLRGTSDAETILSNLERKLGEDPGTFVRNPYDMSADAHRFFTLEAQKPGRQLVYAGRSGLWNNAAISNPLVYEWQEAYNAGNLSAREYVNNYNNWVKSFGGRPGHVDINGKPYFYHPTIFITHKQGGKMNILEFLKNGSGIHIKEKNKGKFTSYCGGKVTDECIRKAKASGNPTLVKRATFAANARKWKHKNGGIIIKAADGTKTNLFLKVGNFLNSDLGKTVGTGLINAFSSWTSSNKLNNAIDSLIEGLKKQNKADINSIQDWALQKATEEITLKFNELLLLFNSGASFERPSPIVFEHLKSQLASKYAQNAINNANLNSQEAIANLESLKTNPISDTFSSLVNTGFDYLSNKFANKALDKNGVPSSKNTSASFYSNPYLKTQNKVGTINFDGSMNTGIGGTTYNWKTNTFGSNNTMNSFGNIKF